MSRKWVAMLCRLFLYALILAMGLQGAGNALAASQLERLLSKVELKTVFPGAERLGPVEGSPPVVAALRGDKTVGYVFLNSDFVSATGYSGRPIHVVVGIDTNGVITGAQMVEHHEPIVLIGIPEERIRKVIDGYRGRSVIDVARGDTKHDVDIVSGATVTVMVIDDSVLRSGIKVARKLGLGGLAPDIKAAAGTRAVIDPARREVESWTTLVGEGSVRSLNISIGQLNDAFARSSHQTAEKLPEPGKPNDLFISLNTALVSVPSIGLSLLGEHEDRILQAQLDGKRQAILVMARGRYSFRGSSFVRGGIFDRIQLIQGDNSIRFRDRDYKRLRKVAAAGAPAFEEVALFTIPAKAEFDPAEPWRIELLVGRATGPTSKAFLTFDLGYRLPQRYLKLVAAPAPPTVVRGPPPDREAAAPALWKRLWQNKWLEVAVLVAALGLLTAIFFVQDWLARHPVLTDRTRVAFLVFTLFGIGFYSSAQLSVVNVMTFFNSLLTDFRWEYFLMEPLIFTLWFGVAASLMFWGRGAFCGWLCPFGALQELLNRGAKLLGVPQIEVPWWLHERAWALKYMIFMVLIGVSLYSLGLAERLAEVEPFKTVIVLKFAREWPFVLFAAVLLLAGLFIERFYCRYLCPLGAALAIPGKLRLFEWLKRYRQCGSPCQRCATDCMVQAIHPEGQINPNECLYCLHCQTLYYDGDRCPVVIQRRLRSERRGIQPPSPRSSPSAAAAKPAARPVVKETK